MGRGGRWEWGSPYGCRLKTGLLLELVRKMSVAARHTRAPIARLSRRLVSNLDSMAQQGAFRGSWQHQQQSAVFRQSADKQEKARRRPCRPFKCGCQPLQPLPHPGSHPESQRPAAMQASLAAVVIGGTLEAITAPPPRRTHDFRLSQVCRLGWLGHSARVSAADTLQVYRHRTLCLGNSHPAPQLQAPPERRSAPPLPSPRPALLHIG